MEKKNGFYWSDEREPHFDRRKEILSKYPQIRELFGIDKGLKWKTLSLVVFQLASAPFIAELAWYWYVPLAYFIGASVSHTLFLAIHELSHDLAFKDRVKNNWLALIANLPIIFPYAMSFRTYHLKHHWEQGDAKNDTDLPTDVERKIFKGYIGKLLWATNQILFYALRPMFVHPIKLEKWHKINIVFQIAAIALYWYVVGTGAILYLLLSIFLAGSLHPLAGHFIAEHYVFVEGQETYSYYGPLNIFALNVGYHNEHHDFPNVPGTRLPDVKKTAPDYYDNLFTHKSWSMVIVKFIMNPRISLGSRVKRYR
ncbi:fatty acid desaturase [Reichenbachiella ulvae]|uniref:Fatty acid desaturase n=1 Tax=Reichenbachiella ulvae TaxID=2980104 RepID=A0ABT3CNM5_9BACT|nr:fatty acid desaturase [Reichenbachiella ulvae]MCV9385242.1 fatty acid desaturase [Reichenbachiella ulvae]